MNAYLVWALPSPSLDGPYDLLAQIKFCGCNVGQVLSPGHESPCSIFFYSLAVLNAVQEGLGQLPLGEEEPWSMKYEERERDI